MCNNIERMFRHQYVELHEDSPTIGTTLNWEEQSNVMVSQRVINFYNDGNNIIKNHFCHHCTTSKTVLKQLLAHVQIVHNLCFYTNE